jgi:hypothetical protein
MGNPILEALDFDGERGIISFKGRIFILVLLSPIIAINFFEPIEMIS